jgi:hypothetical protein
MSIACTHTHDSGEICKSPAIRGTALCFHHTPHKKIERQFPYESEPFELPKIHSKSNIIFAISEVLQRMAQRRLKRSDANTYLHGFALTARIMSELDREAAANPIGFDEMQSVTPPESETTSESLQQTLNEIAVGLGIELPSMEEMQNIQASMPNATAEQALGHWISTGRICAIPPAGGITAGAKTLSPSSKTIPPDAPSKLHLKSAGITPTTDAAWVGNNNRHQSILT